MFKQKLQQGFTLIELLVVIAIIGILAATVLAALGSARSSGSNASVTGSISSVRSQAEIFYNIGSSYTGMCADTAVLNLLNAGAKNGPTGTTVDSVVGTAGDPTHVECHTQAASWAVAAPLNLAGGTTQKYFCVDSTGKATSTTASLAGSGATQYACP